MNRPDVAGSAVPSVILFVPLCAWYGFLRKRPSELLLELDRAQGTARLRRSWTLFWRTHVERLADFVGAEQRKPWLPNPALTTSWLRFHKHAWPLLPRYATGPKGDGLELGAYISDWIQKNES